MINRALVETTHVLNQSDTTADPLWSESIKAVPEPRGDWIFDTPVRKYVASGSDKFSRALNQSQPPYHDPGKLQFCLG